VNIEEETAIFWTYERDGEIFDCEFDSQSEAQAFAENIFIEECEDEGGWSNGSGSEDDIVLIEFTYTDDGDRAEIQRIESTVEFEYYHGDFAEHGTWG